MRNHPFTLVLLHPSTCVGLRYEYFANKSYEVFLGSELIWIFRQFWIFSTFEVVPHRNEKLSYGFANKTFLSKERKSNNPLKLLHFVAPSELAKKGRNINRLPIPRHFSVTKLGSPNPWLISIAKETLDFRCSAFSAELRLLMPTFSLPFAPPKLTLWLQRKENAPLPSLCEAQGSVSSVFCLSPVKSSALLCPQREQSSLLAPRLINEIWQSNSELLHTL